jgi:ATP/maltotriose-dependent transcriptional regulator MalT
MHEEPTATLISPAPGHIIERPRLTTLLEDSGARVILLVAPAGYGKTTLARQWAARQSGPVAWYRTTRASGDVTALAVGLDNVLAAAASPGRRDPNRIAAIASVNPHPTPLANALVSVYGESTQEVLLVVDEYEAAGTDEADELLGRLVDGLSIRFLVTSRHRPAWLAPRFTVYGEGLEVGLDELAMTDDEALAVLSRSRAPGDRERVLETAKGWPAVIGLAAMRAARDLPKRALAPRMLYDFLAGELLDSAPAGMRKGLALLAAASIGDVLTAELVLGEGAGSTVEEARRRGLVQLEDDGSLALHPLLRDLLLNDLDARSASGRDELVGQLLPLIDAARWDEALAASEALKERDFVSTALQRALPDLVRAGRVATLRRWAAVARAAGIDEGLADYAEAEVALRDADFNRAIALGEKAAARLSGDQAARAHLVAGRAANLTDRSARATRNFEAAERLADSPVSKAAALWGRFTQAVDDEREDAEELLDAFKASPDASLDKLMRTAVGEIRIGLLEGGLAEHLDAAEPALRLVGPGADPFSCSSLLNAYAAALSFLGRYEEALENAERQLAIAAEHELEFVGRHALVSKTHALIGRRYVARAERCLSELEQRLRCDADAFLDANRRIERARLQITVGDLEGAHGSLFHEPDRRLSCGTHGAYLALRSLVFAGLGRKREAAACIARAVKVSRFVHSRALTVVATCVIQGGEATDQALADLLGVGALDAVVLGCRGSREFAQRFAEDERRREALATLLAQSNDYALARRIGIGIPRSARRSVALSPRELEIHELIAQGRKNREIAELLFIGESTAKLHVRHIFEKLGVRSRVEAARVWQAARDREEAS